MTVLFLAGSRPATVEFGRAANQPAPPPVITPPSGGGNTGGGNTGGGTTTPTGLNYAAAKNSQYLFLLIY